MTQLKARCSFCDRTIRSSPTPCFFCHREFHWGCTAESPHTKTSRICAQCNSKVGERIRLFADEQREAMYVFVDRLREMANQ